MADLKAVYVAHPLNAPTAEGRDYNRETAQRWVAWLADRYVVAPVADWILLAGEWPETPQWRATGLEIDRVLVELCGTIVLVGPRVSEGMKLEAGWAATIVDLTGIYDPSNWQASTRDGQLMMQLAIMDARMAAAGIVRRDG